jgi:LysM domain-containing protein
MQRIVVVGLMLLMAVLSSQPVFAQGEEPTVYVIQKGDTLWGLSQRFLQDPYYWPNLWARNQSITNPHFIFPGQRLKVYPDRIEVESPAETPAPVAPGEQPPVAPKKAVEEVAQVKTFTVSGGEGFLMENDLKPEGFIVSTHQGRQMVGEDDIVYTDIGKVHGAEVGDKFSIYKKMGAVSHPVTNLILGYRVIPLGTLQLSELEEKVSKAIVTKSFLEIGAGSFLLPYQPRRTEVALKASDMELVGYIVETLTGKQAIATGDIAYLDLGRAQGVEVGNMLYIVRDVVPDQKYALDKIDKLPVEVLGALVVVGMGEHTSTALVVKSIDAIYRGDRVELKKNR